MGWVNVINDAYLSRDGLTIDEISKDHIVKILWLIMDSIEKQQNYSISYKKIYWKWL